MSSSIVTPTRARAMTVPSGGVLGPSRPRGGFDLERATAQLEATLERLMGPGQVLRVEPVDGLCSASGKNARFSSRAEDSTSAGRADEAAGGDQERPGAAEA
jgi:hypothetical protein